MLSSTTTPNISSEGPSGNTIALLVCGIIAGTLVFAFFWYYCCCKRDNPTDLDEGNDRTVNNRSNSAIFIVSPVYRSDDSTLPPPYTSVVNDDNSCVSEPVLTIPRERPPSYSELPSYENAAQFVIDGNRNNEDAVRDFRAPQRQISRGSLRIRRPPRQLCIQRHISSENDDSGIIISNQETDPLEIDNPTGPQHSSDTSV
ncbi:hypothetical protein SNE40_006416 [Patella caerulea]|uniref:Uncharacterized protein n=1 Tax=Patella caerulea TaxID=87958 RepID=A0AAN8Q118_PATCE